MSERSNHDSAIIAEQTLIGALMNYPNELGTVAGMIRGDDFAHVGHRRLFALMVARKKEGHDPDRVEFIGAASRLQHAGLLMGVKVGQISTWYERWREKPQDAARDVRAYAARRKASAMSPRPLPSRSVDTFGEPA